MNRTIKLGDKVYLLLSPSNKDRGYRKLYCTISSIWGTGHFRVNELEYDDNDIELMKKVQISVKPVEVPEKYYTSKHLDKIYFEDELEQLEQDIENLNQILEFKVKQKEELRDYISNNFKNWNYKGTITI